MDNTSIGFTGVLSQPVDVIKIHIDMDKHFSGLVTEVINVINKSRQYCFPLDYSSLFLKYPTCSDSKGQGLNLKLRPSTRLISIYF